MTQESWLMIIALFLLIYSLTITLMYLRLSRKLRDQT
ncbi:hypothetical protein CAURIS_07205 [Corynebacterium auris]|nr:hypothetical protein CAURIS_07205 [Corynebacterium auris]